MTTANQTPGHDKTTSQTTGHDDDHTHEEPDVLRLAEVATSDGAFMSSWHAETVAYARSDFQRAVTPESFLAARAAAVAAERERIAAALADVLDVVKSAS